MNTCQWRAKQSLKPFNRYKLQFRFFLLHFCHEWHIIGLYVRKSLWTIASFRRLFFRSIFHNELLECINCLFCAYCADADSILPYVIWQLYRFLLVWIIFLMFWLMSNLHAVSLAIQWKPTYSYVHLSNIYKINWEKKHQNHHS